METIKRHTESFLFENSDGIFRAIPFYELSIEEWVVYQKGQPKYLIDFNRQDLPLIRDLKMKLESGEELDKVVARLGRVLGKQWTIHHNINGNEIPDSCHQETVELLLLDNLDDLFMDLTFIATDHIEVGSLLNENRLFEKYLVEVENGCIDVESAHIDNEANLGMMLSFLFGTRVELTRLASGGSKEVFDLTEYVPNCITIKEFEESYMEWIKTSGKREYNG